MGNPELGTKTRNLPNQNTETIHRPDSGRIESMEMTADFLELYNLLVKDPRLKDGSFYTKDSQLIPLYQFKGGDIIVGKFPSDKGIFQQFKVNPGDKYMFIAKDRYKNINVENPVAPSDFQFLVIYNGNSVLIYKGEILLPLYAGFYGMVVGSLREDAMPISPIEAKEEFRKIKAYIIGISLEK